MKKRKSIISICLTVVLMIALIPQAAFADTLTALNFVSESDYSITTGVSTTINFTLTGESGAYTGSVSATLTSPGGNVTDYAVANQQGSCSISNVELDSDGTYTLTVTDESGNSVEGDIDVSEPNVVVTGNLIVNDSNPSHRVTLRLYDGFGNLLKRTSVTIDGTRVGAGTQTITTDANGYATFTMTATMIGYVNVVVGGHVISTIEVEAAYTQDDRIGEDAYDNSDLSVSVAEEGWETASTVILTRDDDMVDAMTAAPLSKDLDAPILMTPTDVLDDGVLEEMTALGTTTVYIIGGTGAISSDVEQKIISAGMTVTRIEGSDRYETAALIAEELSSTDTVYLASGHGEADTIAVSPFAAEEGNAILLTEKYSIPEVTKIAIEIMGASNVIIIGGTGIVDSSVEESLSEDYAVERWGGYDRYATQQLIFQNLVDIQDPQALVYFTSSKVTAADVSGGKPNAGALLGAALAAKNGGYIMMLPKNSIPDTLEFYMKYNKGYVTEGAVIGNRDAISGGLESTLKTLLAH
jgi:putative cell wall-binding protein